MNEIESDKKNMIYTWLNNMKPGARFDLSKYYNKTDSEFIIETTKEYICTHPYGNGIEFNHDYTIIKKQKLFIP